MEHTARILSLESLRFIFISLIFLSHFSWGSVDMWNFGGDCGVCFFFMLSGFVLSLAPPHANYRKFVKHRIIKIYPSHLLALIVAGVCMPWAFSVASTIAAITLTQSWFPDSSIYFGANGVAWFLSDLVLFYLLFPWLKRFIFDCRPILLSDICAVMLMLYVIVLVPAVPEQSVGRWLYVFPPARAIDFCLGIILARIFLWIKNRDTTVSEPIGNLLELMSVTFMVMIYIIYPNIPERWATASLFWLPCAIIILIFTITDPTPGAVGKILKHRILLWLSTISFEFYLIHLSIISLLHRINDHFALSISPIIALPSTICLAVVSAWLFKKVRRV